jgi:Lipopolysaccharide-assembly
MFAMPHAAFRIPHCFLGVLLAGLTSCGYTLLGTPATGMSTRIALAVPPVRNQSREPGLESSMTAALRRAIVQSSALSLVPESNAPRHLQSVVRQFRVLPTSFDMGDNVVQYRIEAEARVRLIDRASDLPVLEQDISVSAEYLISTVGIVRQNVVAREAAIFRLAQRFAEKCTALLEVTLL